MFYNFIKILKKIMGIDITEKEGKDITVYQFPDFIKKREYIGNKLDDFEILGILEDGENSKVLKVKSKYENGIYAMKQIELKLIEKYNLQNEINLFININHPSIIKCYNAFDEGNYKYIIMEFMNNGDLESYKELNTAFGINIALQKLVEIAYNCLSVLECIHSQNRNLQIKLKNIFIDDNFNIKIGILNLTSIISFEPNPNQNRLDLQILGNILDYLLNYYEKEQNEVTKKINMFSFNSYLKEEKNISTSNAKEIIKEMYVKYCVKNSSIKSVLYCLNNFSNINFYFSDKNIKKFISKDNAGKNKILAKQFMDTINSLNLKDNDKEKIDDSLFELRRALDNDGFYIKNDYSEIFPENLIPFILVKLNNELCEVTVPKNREDEKRDAKIYGILGKHTYFNSKINQQSVFNVILNIYNEKFSSYISRNFLTFIRTTSFCEECSNSTINFSWIYFFNISTRQYSKASKINIDKCLSNKGSKVIKQCDYCEMETSHREEKNIYKPARNLIIILDRGKNYDDKTFIDFDEELTINNEYYNLRGNKEVKYQLKGIISKKNEYNSYRFFIKKDNIWKSSSINDFISLNIIKNNGGLIISLFYEIENKALSHEDLDLNFVFNKLPKKSKNLNTFINLDMEKNNSSPEMLSNGYQNYYNTFINNNIQIQNQNNYNLQLQNNISDSNFYNKEKSCTYINNNLSFNIFETNINGNNMNQINNNAMMYENNNQQILENQNQYNPNYQFNNEQQSSNNNAFNNLSNENNNLNNYNEFISYDSSGNLQEYQGNIFIQKSEIPKYNNKGEYNIIDKIQKSEIQESKSKIGFL